VVENTALPLVLAGVPDARARHEALESLHLVGAAALAPKLPEELSGGQAQRVAIARVLALRPKLILADEPTGQLDRATGRHIVDVLIAAADGIGAALVVTTHDPTVAVRFERQWAMHEGRLLPERARPNAARAGAAHPDTAPDESAQPDAVATESAPADGPRPAAVRHQPGPADPAHQGEER
jgi:ABC-type lipoprotein export system ATPase subunit